MSTSAPSFAVHVPKSDIERPRTLERVLRRALPRVRSVSREVLSAFEFKNDEGLFARQLLRRATQLWLFRTHQRKFCGDFIVVDMSSPDPERRPVWVIDLKLGASLKVGGGGAGVQLTNTPRAVAEIARTTGAVSRRADPLRVTGDRRAVLALLGVRLA